MIEAREFGASLRRERERRGISLEIIAEQTKVSASLLAGMERGDLSRWPAGIFRRAFVRSYAAAVGLDVEDTLAEFLRVFPEDGGPVRPRQASAAAHSLRLTLGESPGAHVDWRRLSAAGIDAGVLGASALAGWLAGTPETACLALLAAALLWHGAGTLLWATSPGLHLLRRRPQTAPKAAARPAPEPPVETEAEDEMRRTPPVARVAPRVRLGRRERRAAARAERTHTGDPRHLT